MKKAPITVEDIKKAVSAIKADRPAYRELLAFYEMLFLAQETAKATIALEPIEISKDLLCAKREGGLPLISMADFVIDTAAAEQLLERLCDLAQDANAVLAKAGAGLKQALSEGTLTGSQLFSKILDQEDAFWDETARRIDAEKPAVAFLVYNAVKPCLSLCAEALCAYLDKDHPWTKGYCPVCGGLPVLSLLRDEGKRSLVCGVCGHEWDTSRIFCPFCENKDQKKRHYFFSEQEKEYRVDVCDACDTYLKTLDTRHVTRPVYCPVEQVATLHLDIQAQGQGLKSGLPLWLQT
ncbi:MAG: formate dehydrogenase accessory protein FdhE [Deltaproteobacteria bacterium]|nr:formate dehydrogenase accessory protein FdhE [Deltaproteobacteria bacterium]